MNVDLLVVEVERFCV